MKKRISAILLPLLVAMVCIPAVEGLYSVLGAYLFAPVEKNTTITQVAEQKQVTNNTTQRTAEEYVRIVLERDLFGPSPAAAQDLPSERKNPPDLQASSLSLVLMGTIVSEGEESRAIILEKDQNRQNIYHKGEVVQGAVLKKILRGKVVLTFNNRDEILDMSEAAKYSAKTPSPVPIVATPEMRQEQILPGSEPQTNEIPLPSPVSALTGTQRKLMRPDRRAYVPMPDQSSQ